LNKYNFNSFKKFKSEKLLLLICVLLYLFIGLFLIQNYLFILNTDGISYIHIAQHYVNGQFYYAINGYWSPLYSWLLIPFLFIWQEKLGILFAVKLLSLLIGCFTFWGVYLLSRKLKFDFIFQVFTLITLIPMVLYFAFIKTTPDLLNLTILIFYLNFILDTNYLHSLRMGLLTGLFGAFAFLSKSYAFFFFLIQFALVNSYYWMKFKKNRKIITKNFILGLTVFLVISGVWIALISDKYDKITIGTSGSYNHAVFGPETQGHPNYFQGLMGPYNKYDSSIWDDPSYTEIEDWSPLSSTENFYYQLEFTASNVLESIKIIESFSVLSILIILLVFFIILKSTNEIYKDRLKLILLTIFIYSAGYCLIFVETRYLWFISVLLLLLGVFSIKILSEEYSINKKVSIILVFIICWSFMLNPLFNLYNISGNGKEIYYLSENLKNYGIEGSNIAASSADWRDTLILSYYLDTKYYGLTNPKSSEKEISDELHNNNIKFFIWWQKDSIDIPGYNRLVDPNLNYPIIYKLNEN
jgi:hypothetical protein